MDVKLRPFRVPNFVLLEIPAGQRQDGFRELPTIPLSAVPAEDLADLCDAFRREVFRKAKQSDPWIKERAPVAREGEA